MRMPTINAGLHRHVPFADYLAWPIWSQSTIKEAQKSPRHAQAAFNDPGGKEATDAMTLGSALHTAFLEPECMTDYVVKWTGPRRAGKEWEAFKAEHAGKAILTNGMHEKLVGMVRSLRSHPFVRSLLSKIEDTEIAGVKEIGGLLVKGRADALTSNAVIDIKSSSDLDPRRITSTIVNFGYHIQAALYTQLFSRHRFIMLFVEESAPHDVVPIAISPAWLRYGRHELEELIGTIIECERSGQWPGRAEELVELDPPEWAVPETEADGITLDGAAIFQTAA